MTDFWDNKNESHKREKCSNEGTADKNVKAVGLS